MGHQNNEDEETLSITPAERIRNIEKSVAQFRNDFGRHEEKDVDRHNELKMKMAESSWKLGLVIAVGLAILLTFKDVMIRKVFAEDKTPVEAKVK